MKDWNVVVTSFMHQERRLLQELHGLGEFQPSGFREVIIGLVPDVGDFLENLRRAWEDKPFLAEFLSTVAPVREVFPFTPENLLTKLQEKILALLPEIGDRAFYVRVKRRGHKGEISSQELEQALDQFLKEELESQGRKGRIDFAAPEAIVVVEAIHNQCGLGLVSREMKERYQFVKVK